MSPLGCTPVRPYYDTSPTQNEIRANPANPWQENEPPTPRPPQTTPRLESLGVSL